MRTLKTKTLPRIFLVMALALAPLPGLAQPGKLELPNLENLSNKAAVVNDITLDGPLLALAMKVLDMDGDSEAKQVKDAIKGVKGIYVKNFEFDEPGQYDQADVQAIRAQLTRPPWSPIVRSVNKRHAQHSEIYLLKDGDKIGGLAILVTGPKELTVVNIVGFVDMDKIAVLGGKFGIPEDIKDKDDDRPRHKPASQQKSDKPDKKEKAHEDMSQDDEDQ